MKKIMSMLACAVFLLAGCESFIRDEIAELHSEIDVLKKRLDELCEEMNTNISSLQKMVDVLRTADYIESIVPIVENGEEIGFVITFTESGSVTIYHGKDGVDGAPGKDGHVPVVGVRQGEDGVWFWTIDGNWMLDSDGNKIPSEGVLPQLKVEDEYWHVSYDNGKTWTRLGKAVGEDGVDGAPGADGEPGKDGDAMFSSVTVGSTEVEFVLADGTTFIIPFYGKIGIEFALVDGEVGALPGSQIEVGYTLTGASEQTKVSASSDGNYSVLVKSTSKDAGKLLITCPDPYVDGYVNVIIADNNGYYDLHVINFYENKIEFSKGLQYTVPAEGGSVKIPFSSNFGYTMNITSGSAWMSYVQTKAPAMVSAEIEVTAAMNMNSSSRTGKIAFYPENSSRIYREVTVTQAAAYYSIDQWKFAFPADGGDVQANIKSSRGLKIVVPAGVTWITPEITSTSGTSYVVTITSQQNPADVKRNASISLYSADGTMKLGTIELVQVGVAEENPNDMIFKVRANYVNDFTAYLPIAGRCDCYIDWGDGLVEYVNRSITNASTVPSHKYNVAEPTSFRVKISGTVPQISSSYIPLHTVEEVEQWGLTGLTSLSNAFNGNQLLTKVPTDDGGAFVNVTNCSYMFNECGALTEIPAGLFDNCTKVKTFACAFENCRKLVSLPPALFAGCVSVTSFSSVFRYCSALTELPDRMFAGCVSATGFYEAFSHCENLKYIPGNIFKECRHVQAYHYMFWYCTALETIPEGLFDDSPNVTDFKYTFSGCSSLKSVPVSLFDKQRGTTEFSCVFASCKLTGESPYTIVNGVKVHLYERSDYPDYFVAPLSYSNAFHGCTLMSDYSSIPTSWK